MAMQAIVTETFVGKCIGNYAVEHIQSQEVVSSSYFARHVKHGHAVTITLYHILDRLSSQTRTRFSQRFSRVLVPLMQLRHPNLLSLYDYGEQEGYPYLVTPAHKEGTLLQQLKRQGRYTPSAAIEVIRQIASCLEYMHRQGITHGSLRTARVVTGTSSTIQVAGFGRAQIETLRGIEQHNHPLAHLLDIGGTFLGAPEYTAPECVLGQIADARADIYALGIILFELLSGQAPFSGYDPFGVAMQRLQYPVPSLSALRPDLPAEIDTVLARILSRNPTQRYMHADEFVVACSHALQNQISIYTVPDNLSAVRQFVSNGGSQKSAEEVLSAKHSLRLPAETPEEIVAVKNGVPRVTDTPEGLPVVGLNVGTRGESERNFLLKIVQPSLVGLTDGSVSTLAPIFAVAFATNSSFTAFLVGMASALGAGISMMFSEALSDDGELTGRGHPFLRGGITGVTTFISGAGHTLPFLIPDINVALIMAYIVVGIELFLIAGIRKKYFKTGWWSSIVQVVGGGILVFASAFLFGHG